MTTIYSCTLIGLEGKIIEVQASVSPGMPSFRIVGLGDTSVQESKERVRASIKHSGFNFPLNRKTINLAPAEIRKQGSAYDLPIAVAILQSTNQLMVEDSTSTIFIGELSLDGALKPIHGVISIVDHAKNKGFKRVFLPYSNLQEGSFISGIEVYGLKRLKDLFAFFHNQEKAIIPKRRNTRKSIKITKKESSIIFSSQSRRAALISAAGGHHLLLTGSPGVGKTILGKAIANLLPPMSKKEILETTKIYSVSGRLSNKSPLVHTRPFREVHHSISTAALIGGGGSQVRPGEISLAHNGVLFLDEIREFARPVLESLRQPLEDRSISINRVKFSTQFPARFLLIATTNPCPCGYAFDIKKSCRCSKAQKENYQKKLSGPLLDRFDLVLELGRLPSKDLLSHAASSENFQALYSKVLNAFKLQLQRFKNHSGINCNADMGMEEIKEYCQLDKESKQILNAAIKRMELSNRSFFKLLKIARTIADLESSHRITSNHLAEAVQFHRLPRNSNQM